MEWAERELEAALRRSPTRAEIAAALGVGAEHVLDARLAALARSAESFDRILQRTDEPEGQHADFFPFEESGFAAAENAATLARLLPCLGARVQRTAA